MAENQAHISYSTIGRNIRAARQRVSLTQEALAEKLRISHLHFGRLERGERPISLELLAQIAQALDVRLDDLLSGCVVGGARLEPSDDAQALGRAVAEQATGCSPRARALMLSMCQSIAEYEKLADDKKDLA